MNNFCKEHIDREILFFCFDIKCGVNKKLCILCLKHYHKNCNQNSIVEIDKIGDKLKEIKNINGLVKKNKEIIKFKNDIIQKACLKIKKALDESMKKNFKKEIEEENKFSEKRIKLIKKLFDIHYDEKSEKVIMDINLENKKKSIMHQKIFLEEIINSLQTNKFNGNILDIFQITSFHKKSNIEQISKKEIKISTVEEDEIVIDDNLTKNRLYKIIGKYKTEAIDEEKNFGFGFIEKDYFEKEKEKNHLKSPCLKFDDGINFLQKKNFKGSFVFKFLQKDFEIFFFIDIEKKELSIFDEGKKNIDLKLSKNDIEKEKKVFYFNLKNIEINLQRVVS